MAVWLNRNWQCAQVAKKANGTWPSERRVQTLCGGPGTAQALAASAELGPAVGVRSPARAISGRPSLGPRWGGSAAEQCRPAARAGTAPRGTGSAPQSCGSSCALRRTRRLLNVRTHSEWKRNFSLVRSFQRFYFRSKVQLLPSFKENSELIKRLLTDFFSISLDVWNVVHPPQSKECSSVRNPWKVRKYTKEAGREHSWGSGPKLSRGIFHTIERHAQYLNWGEFMEPQPVWGWSEGGEQLHCNGGFSDSPPGGAQRQSCIYCF
ncbi:uncharacterized protein LOC119703477 [Motacilla alba alba]|uniref:uncharacterized protein LOC119703477 n=1 Tax=Motacilla alba alba TaxID=1094192 RepID=UPI0018D54F2A|nr:uncharacterized protein LOC119703477 [Motacilla alba alba]